jgi:hypothetical protein
VAQGIVDGLEAVHIKQEDCRPFVALHAVGLGFAQGGGESGTVAQTGQGIGHSHLLHGQVGFMELLCPGLHPLFQLFVDDLEIFGQEVGAHDHGVNLIAGIRDRNPGIEVTRRQLDDVFQEQPQPGVVRGI